MSSKNSFLLYNDLIDVVREMPKDKAGELFECILEYANGNLWPTNDPMVKVVFAPVKRHMDQNKEKWEKKAQINKGNGSKGGRPKSNPTISQENPLSFSETQTIPEKPVTVTDILLEKETKDILSIDGIEMSRSEAFDLFWDMYGNKTGKKKCIAKFSKLSEADVTKILNAVPVYIRHCREKDKFIKNPETWLNGEHWNDEISDNKNSTPEPMTYSKPITYEDLANQFDEQEAQLAKKYGYSLKP